MTDSGTVNAETVAIQYDWGIDLEEEVERSKKTMRHTFAVPEGKFWWDKWDKSKILFFDTEFIEILKPDEKAMNKSQCFQIGVTNWNGDFVYKANICHAPGTFRTSNRVNGIHQNSFKKGIRLDVVSRAVRDIFEDSLVINYGPKTDFECLNINQRDYNSFNLQSYFWHYTDDDDDYHIINDTALDMCDKPTENLSLRATYYHYFKEFIQSRIHHDAYDDAMAVRRLFVEVYVKQKMHNNDKSIGNNYPSPMEIKSKRQFDRFAKRFA